ncbi:MAG: hypothetical protein AAB874_04125 [Patescibacteria group bacterium]
MFQELRFQPSNAWAARDVENSPNTFHTIDHLPHLVLARKLGLLHPAFSDEILASIGSSEWWTIDEGNNILEVRNHQFVSKLRGAVDIVDYDDCLFKATEWHKREYELIANNQQLLSKGIAISFDEARKIYQMSKILIPGKAELEPRYTPLLNLLLLTQFARKLEKGMERNTALEEILVEKDQAREIISRAGEDYFTSFPYDQDVVDIFINNPPSNFRDDPVVDQIFNNSILSGDLKIIATRGKIEGPFGQVYKLHASGIMEKGVDLVLYTNDLKAAGILLLSQLFPQLQDMCIRVFDDNRDEILPYRELALIYGIRNLKLIHVRLPNAKRSHEAIGDDIKPDYCFVDQETGIMYDHYLPFPALFRVS